MEAGVGGWHNALYALFMMVFDESKNSFDF